jgi:hypothetical protein
VDAKRFGGADAIKSVALHSAQTLAILTSEN